MQDKENKVSQERRVFVKKVWILPTLVAMGGMQQKVHAAGSNFVVCKNDPNNPACQKMEDLCSKNPWLPTCK